MPLVLNTAGEGETLRKAPGAHGIRGLLKLQTRYEYDFGDGWEHEIVIEDLLAPEPRAKYPRCIAGERHCPLEDVGGPWGYDEFLQAIRDEDHPAHEEFVDWIGGSFDPEAFDLEAVNRDLKQIR